MTNAADNLADWIAELRARLARGGLAGLGPIDMHGVTQPVERVARFLLSDLDDLDAEDGACKRRYGLATPQRREALLADFRRLREQIG